MSTLLYSNKSVTATAPDLEITVGSSSAYRWSSTALQAFTIGVLVSTDLPLWLLLPALCFSLVIYIQTCTGLTAGTRQNHHRQGLLRWRSGNRLSWLPGAPVPGTASTNTGDSTIPLPAENIWGSPASSCYQCPAFIVIGIVTQSTEFILIPRDAVAPAAFRALRARIGLYRPDDRHN